jgi:hypothetical protein
LSQAKTIPKPARIFPNMTAPYNKKIRKLFRWAMETLTAFQ